MDRRVYWSIQREEERGVSNRWMDVRMHNHLPCWCSEREEEDIPVSCLRHDVFFSYSWLALNGDGG